MQWNYYFQLKFIEYYIPSPYRSAPMFVIWLYWWLYQVTLVELSKPSFSLQKILFSIGSSAIGIKQLQDGLTLNNGMQARMDEIMFQGSEGSSLADPLFGLLKEYISYIWSQELMHLDNKVQLWFRFREGCFRHSKNI